MVSMSQIRASNARVAEELAPLTAVFTGATDGIGKAALAQLVKTRLPIKAYIIGRNGDKHKAFLEELRRVNGKAEIIWLEGQVSLMSDIKRVCEEIKSREQSIDLLYQSAGQITGGQRFETSEGNLLNLALTYYGRVLFMLHLLPLLNASTNSPRTMVVLAAGNESDSVQFDDIELKKPGRFGMVPLSLACATYTTLTLSRLAHENPRVVFIHHYPGGVDTDVFKKVWGDKWWFGMMHAAFSLVGIPVVDAGDKVVYMATSAKYGGKGVPLGTGERRALNYRKTMETGELFGAGEKLSNVFSEKALGKLNKAGASDILWKHTMERLGNYTP